MSYRAKEVKKITEYNQRMTDLKINVGKSTGCLRFFWLDDHLEVEEKLWHPLIMLKYLVVIILHVPFAIAGSSTPLLGFDSFRSSNHPTAKRITDSNEINDAIVKDKAFRKSEFDKHSWV
jgi:hypothetical protein